MEYRKIGNSGLKVSEIGLGGNNFGRWADEATSIAVINQALEMGINFIDTADMYAAGKSEEYVGKAVKGKRDKVVIATKCGYPMGEGPNDRGASRAHIMTAIDNSLKRLQTDYIDLFYTHVPDPTTPIEETLRTYDSLVRSGRVRYIGCSNFAAWQLCEALWTAKAHNFPSYIVIQSYYNLLERQLEKEVVPCCQSYHISVIPWGPLAGGFLTGKYRKDEQRPAGTRLSQPFPLYDGIFTDANWAKLAKLETFAGERGHTVSELAIASLLAKPWIPAVIAGARKIEQVADNAKAAAWKLTPEEAAAVEAICKP